MITIYRSARALTSQEVKRLPRQSIARAWSSAQLSRPFSWTFAIDPENLWFLCDLEGGQMWSRDRSKGEFVEGLWEADVGEFFLKDSNGRYQEFNLAPSGAWWSVVLESYRSRASDYAVPQVTHIHTEVREGEWSGVIAVRRESLAVALSSESSMHVSGVRYHPSVEYFSSHPDRAVEPDFHRASCFQPIEFRALS